MSDIFQEVQEEYRREQMAKLWAKYRVAIVGGATALIVGVAGYQAYSYWRTGVLEQSSRAYDVVSQTLSEPGQEKEAADRLAKLAATGAGAYPMMATLEEAGLRVETGDVKAAIALYDKASSLTGEPLFRDYAQLRAAILVIDSESLDNIKKRLEPIASGSGPWKIPAAEMLAYASWRAGKKDEALKLYAEVEASPNATQGVKRRATEMSALINAGMTLADLKITSPLAIPPSGAGPMLLQPTVPEPSNPSLPGIDLEPPPTP